MNAAFVMSAVRLTLRDPRAAVAWLRGLRLTPADVLSAAIAVAAVSTLLGWAAIAGAPDIEGEGPWTLLATQPMTMAGLQLFALLFGAMLMRVAGRAFGGLAGFSDCLLVLVWIEVILTAVQAVQVAMMLLFPATATLLTVLGFALFLYLIVRLTTAVHGFSSPVLVAMGMIGTLMLAGAALSMFAAAFGLLPEVPAP